MPEKDGELHAAAGAEEASRKRSSRLATPKLGSAQKLAEEFSPEELDFDGDEGDETSGQSPIEELVEEPLPETDNQDKAWYILKVQVNRENSICEALQRNIKRAGLESYFGEILVPTEDVREFSKSGKQRIVKRKLYPGYVVVRMAVNDHTWFLVRDTAGIGDFTGAAGKPVPLSQTEVDRILASSRTVKTDEGPCQRGIFPELRRRVVEHRRTQRAHHSDDQYFWSAQSSSVGALASRRGLVWCGPQSCGLRFGFPACGFLPGAEVESRTHLVKLKEPGYGETVGGSS
jgi:transcriptional antiterminator NusG